MPTTVDELKIAQLPPYQKRSFVPEKADLSNKEEAVKLYQQLLNRSIQSKEELEQWLMDRSELEACLDQEGAILYIHMTCQTDDPQKANAYRHFIETVVPAVKPLEDQCNQKYLKERKRFPLDRDFYQIYDRTVQVDIDLFRNENVPLQTKVALLAQKYQEIFGTMMVNFEGQEYTLPQMAKFLLSEDRSIREQAWRATAKRRLKEHKRLDDVFEEMLRLRHKIAVNAGFRNFCEYQFMAYHRFDYTQKDCRKYHEAVEDLVVPLWKKILARRRSQMKLASLRPWDLDVDPLGRPALAPFTKAEELVEGVKTIFEHLNKELGEQFQQIMELGLLELPSRKGKAPGGYQAILAEVRKPFIFMNAVGLDDDVRTLLHEGGHAFHALASASQKLFAYRHAPMEFCEVASMSMELLGGEHLFPFYNTEDQERSCLRHLEDVVYTLLWVATIDTLQEWIYIHPDQSSEERAQAWLKVHQRFGSEFLDWRDLEEEHKFFWHRQLHIFEAPFYYIEYGIAQLGALQIWLSTKKNLSQAMSKYRHALTLGRSRPLPDLFATAGLKFDFSAKTIVPLVKLLSQELKII